MKKTIKTYFESDFLKHAVGCKKQSVCTKHPNGQTLTPNPSPIEEGNKCGFTLAEVLITLIIIGVIAAITVPTLITKYQKEQTVTRLKKSYSALSQTTVKATADYGPMSTWDRDSSDTVENTIKFVNKYIVPYMSVIKEPTTPSNGHWNNNAFYLNNESFSFGNNFARFYLSDGTSITTTFNTLGYGAKRLILYIDINGDRKPNKVGRDIFFFNYYTYNPINKYSVGKVQPEGLSSDRNSMITYNTWGCSKDKRGSFCSGLIMYDGWQIKDDYPW